MQINVKKQKKKNKGIRSCKSSEERQEMGEGAGPVKGEAWPEQHKKKKDARSLNRWSRLDGQWGNQTTRIESSLTLLTNIKLSRTISVIKMNELTLIEKKTKELK